MQAEAYHVFRSGDSIKPLDQASDRSFHFEGASYLFIVDYTSTLSSITRQHVANQCRLIFSEYGWPETLISDNGPCYTAEALPV